MGIKWFSQYRFEVLINGQSVLWTMDKNKCTKKNGHKTLSYEELEDECEYNYRRKEELKKEVQRLKDDNDELRDTNFKNFEV